MDIVPRCQMAAPGSKHELNQRKIVIGRGGRAEALVRARSRAAGRGRPLARALPPLLGRPARRPRASSRQHLSRPRVGGEERLDRQLGDGDVERRGERRAGTRGSSARRSAAARRPRADRARPRARAARAAPPAARPARGRRSASTCAARSRRRCARHSPRFSIRGAIPSGCSVSRSALIGGSSRCGAAPAVSIATAALAATTFHARSTTSAGNGSWLRSSWSSASLIGPSSLQRRAASRSARSRRRAASGCARAAARRAARPGAGPSARSGASGRSRGSSGGAWRRPPRARGRAG